MASAHASRLDARKAASSKGMGASHAAHHQGSRPVAKYCNTPDSDAATKRPPRVSSTVVEYRDLATGMSRLVYFITHPDVVIDPIIPVPRWPLSERGLARMRRLLRQPWIAQLEAIYCSTAEIVSQATSLPFHQLAALGENDRSATGYLRGTEFQTTVDAFFARPHESIRGWERAVDAQARIVAAVEGIARSAPGSRPIAVIAHGGVGALFLCHLKAVPISRTEEQPGTSGGHYFLCRMPDAVLVHGWMPIDAES